MILVTFSSKMAENENGQLDWNVDVEVQFFHAMKGHKPVGVNRYFQMACIHEKFSNSLNKEIPSKEIWSHLDSMYDMAALHESEIIPFPNNELEFSLPDSEYGTLKSKRCDDYSVTPIKLQKETEKTVKVDKVTGKSTKSELKGSGETITPKTKEGTTAGKTSIGNNVTGKISKGDSSIGVQKNVKDNSISKSTKDSTSKSNKTDIAKETTNIKYTKDNISKSNKVDGVKDNNISKGTKDNINKSNKSESGKEISLTKNTKDSINKANKTEGPKAKSDSANRGKDGSFTDDTNATQGSKLVKATALAKEEIAENSPKRKRTGRPPKEESSKPSSPVTQAPSKRRRT